MAHEVVLVRDAGDYLLLDFQPVGILGRSKADCVIPVLAVAGVVEVHLQVEAVQTDKLPRGRCVDQVSFARRPVERLRTTQLRTVGQVVVGASFGQRDPYFRALGRDVDLEVLAGRADVDGKDGPVAVIAGPAVGLREDEGRGDGRGGGGGGGRLTLGYTLGYHVHGGWKSDMKRESTNSGPVLDQFLDHFLDHFFLRRFATVLPLVMLDLGD